MTKVVTKCIGAACPLKKECELYDALLKNKIGKACCNPPYKTVRTITKCELFKKL